MIRAAALALSAVVALTAAAPAHASPSDVTLNDIVEVDLGWTTIADNFYERIPPATVLAGARAGMIAYLRAHGVPDPVVGMPHAQKNGRGAVASILQQMGRAIIRYGPHIRTTDFVYATLRGEVAALHDPYAVFFTKAEVATFSQALDGTAFGGIGAAIARDDNANVWHIDRVFPETPAAKAGLQAGDVIAAIDGVPLDVPTADLASARLRGKVGSIVKLGIVRAGAPLAEPVTLTRASVTPPATTVRMLPNDVGYIALRQFDANAGAEVGSAIRDLAAQGATSYVFDLRDDGGGYESAAVSVASQFIASGPIVTVQDRRGKRTTTDATGKLATTKPLVVLVNGDSASGSELATGAIQDTKRGIVVGTRTFGKGVVQTIFPLPDGAAIKITTARYFTAHGRDIEKVGLTPNVIVPEPAGSTIGVVGSDPQLDRALALLAQQPPSPS